MPKARKRNTREYNKRLFIVCEGGKTEPNYFENLIAEYNFRGKPVDVRVINTKKNTAKELVDEAKVLKEIPTDEVWAVFDKDGYTKHHEAFNNAGQQVKIAFSSISFEFWVLLHFEYTTRSFGKSEDIIKYLEKKGYFQSYDKADKSIFIQIKDYTDIAIVNAQRVRCCQIKSNPPRTPIHHMNPYTDVDELVTSIKEISKEYQ